MLTDKLRSYRRSDAAAVARMLNAGRERPRAALDGAGRLRLVRFVPAGARKAVMEHAPGQIAGYAYVADQGDHFIFETGGGIHPDHDEAGVGSLMLSWAEDEAQRLSRAAPAGVRCALQANIFETEHFLLGLHETNGFRRVREWAHYDIRFSGAPSASLPDGLSIREFDLASDADWARVSPVLDLAFQDHWGAYTLPPAENDALVGASGDADDESPADPSYSNAQGFCFIAFLGEETAGAVLCNNKLVEFPETGRIGSIFCHPAHRRRGIGRGLMQTAFNAFYEGGFRRVVLDTDSESFTGSSGFYKNLGMSIYRREFLLEKEIRPGREIRRLRRYQGP